MFWLEARVGIGRIMSVNYNQNIRKYLNKIKCSVTTHGVLKTFRRIPPY